MDRRSKEWTWTSEAASLVRASMAGGDPLEHAKVAYKTAERCGICGEAAQGRPLGAQVLRVVDETLLDGGSYDDVLSAIEPLIAGWPEAERPTYWQIRNHGKRHLEVDARVVRAIVEAEAVEQGLDVEQAEAPLVTPGALFRLIQQRTFEGLARREAEPTVREGLEASRLLDASTSEDLRGKLAQAKAKIGVLVHLLHEIASPEQIEAAYKRLERRQILPTGSPPIALAPPTPTTKDVQAESPVLAGLDASTREGRNVDGPKSASLNGRRTSQSA